MTIREFLPTDTRSIEIISGMSLILIAIIGIVSDHTMIPERLLEFNSWEFWLIIAGLFGSMQIWASVCIKMEPVRAILAWITGFYWTWISSTSVLSLQPNSTIIPVMVIGIACLYAFVINALMVRKAWDLWR